MPPLSSELEQWRDRGALTRVAGLELFAIDEGNEGDEAPVLLLHGFPTSSYDFHRVLPDFVRRRRAVVHDHPGFGLSAKPTRYSYSLFEQADAALGLWRELGIRRGHLVAHDYGTSIATELLARRERGLLPIELLSVTLTNGSIHIELADLRITQQLLRAPIVGPLFARFSTPAVFKTQMRRLWGETPPEERELDLLWEGITLADGPLRLPAISQYLDERTRFWDRWVGALTRLDLPTLVLWGRKDPVAVPAIAERIAAETPTARLEWLESAGHYPMLEQPADWVRAVLDHLDAVERLPAVS